jgi:hypothetical protein
MTEVPVVNPTLDVRRYRPPAAAGLATGLTGALLDFLDGINDGPLTQALAQHQAAVMRDAQVEGTAAGMTAAASGQPPPVSGDESAASQARDKGAMSGWLSRMATNTDERLQALAQQYPANPEALRQAVETYQADQVKLAPDAWKPLLAEDIDKRALPHLAAAETARQRRAEEQNQAKVLTNLNNINQRALRAARAGDGDALAAALAEHGATIGVAMTDGLMTGERAAAMQAGLHQDVVFEEYMGQHDRTMAKGGPSASLRFQTQFEAAAAARGMDPDRVRQASAQMTAERNQLVHQRQAAQADADRARAEQQNAMMSDFYLKANAGQATLADVQKLRAANVPSHLIASGLSMLQKSGESKADDRIFVTLLRRAAEGEDVVGDAHAAASKRDISGAQFSQILNESQQTAGGVRSDALKLIDDITGYSLFRADPAADIRRVNATAEYNTWWQETTKGGIAAPPRAVAQQAAEEIARRWSRPLPQVLPSAPYIVTGAGGTVDAAASAARIAELPPDQRQAGAELLRQYLDRDKAAAERAMQLRNQGATPAPRQVSP